ncbi:MAG TPA: hypothetical protein VLI69_03935 [Gammaproteobacteria bacterium]|nr:hypothetical protein [Gammaproteobacteria bacterium]
MWSFFKKEFGGETKSFIREIAGLMGQAQKESERKTQEAKGLIQEIAELMDEVQNDRLDQLDSILDHHKSDEKSLCVALDIFIAALKLEITERPQIAEEKGEYLPDYKLRLLELLEERHDSLSRELYKLTQRDPTGVFENYVRHAREELFKPYQQKKFEIAKLADPKQTVDFSFLNSFSAEIEEVKKLVDLIPSKHHDAYQCIQQFVNLNPLEKQDNLRKNLEEQYREVLNALATSLPNLDPLKVFTEMLKALIEERKKLEEGNELIAQLGKAVEEKAEITQDEWRKELKDCSVDNLPPLVEKFSSRLKAAAAPSPGVSLWDLSKKATNSGKVKEVSSELTTFTSTTPAPGK